MGRSRVHPPPFDASSTSYFLNMNDSTPLVFFNFFLLVFPNLVSKYELGLTSELDKTKQNKSGLWERGLRAGADFALS